MYMSVTIMEWHGKVDVIVREVCKDDNCPEALHTLFDARNLDCLRGPLDRSNALVAAAEVLFDAAGIAGTNLCANDGQLAIFP
jgi:hypothetical protein